MRRAKARRKSRSTRWPPISFRSRPSWEILPARAAGALLIAGLLGIVYAAAGESTLAAGAAMHPPERRKALAAGAIALVILVLLLAGGWHWWSVDEQNFRRSLREGAWPDLAATVETAGRQRILHLVLGDKTFKPDYAFQLLRDHGKLIHLFLIREPAHDVFAHVHPVQRGGKTFDLALPELPEGDYKILCDFTLSESGLSSTATGSVHLPPSPAQAAQPAVGSVLVDGAWVHLPPVSTEAAPEAGGGTLEADADDSWAGVNAVAPPAKPTEEVRCALPGGRQAIWKAHPPLRAKHDAHLEFTFCDAAGQQLALEPYMGMMSHAAVLRADGKIFAHLHPTGNYSMAAQSFFTTKIAREEAGGTPVPRPRPRWTIPKWTTVPQGGAAGSSIVLPYEFPAPGDYQIWVQIKTGGQVLTAAYATTVAP